MIGLRVSANQTSRLLLILSHRLFEMPRGENLERGESRALPVCESVRWWQVNGARIRKPIFSHITTAAAGTRPLTSSPSLALSLKYNHTFPFFPFFFTFCYLSQSFGLSLCHICSFFCLVRILDKWAKKIKRKKKPTYVQTRVKYPSPGDRRQSERSEPRSPPKRGASLWHRHVLFMWSRKWWRCRAWVDCQCLRQRLTSGHATHNTHTNTGRLLEGGLILHNPQSSSLWIHTQGC